jgi:pimeloyl-ACP methyl ester carboxylesterase
MLAATDRRDGAPDAASARPMEYDLFAPPTASGVRRPLIVVVHGARSQPGNHLDRLRPYAADHGRTVVAPSFELPDFAGFQRLAAAGTPLGAAEAFASAVARVMARLEHTTGPIDLIGFSGGAQFAHRYALLHPDRVRRLVVASAGWYTRLDPGRPFPAGIAPSPASGGRGVDVEAFLAIPTLVAVGERDVDRSPLLRSDPVLDAEQGEHRLARAVRWSQHLHDEAVSRRLPPKAQLLLVPATGHSFRQALGRGLGRSAMAFLAGEGT